VIATTDSALDDLAWHQAARASVWTGRVVPTYRPDEVTDPDFEGFQVNVERLGATMQRIDPAMCVAKVQGNTHRFSATYSVFFRMS
jgi:glucuronate isomerase